MSDGSFWLPPAASTGAHVVDRLFYLIYWIAFIFFAIVVGLMVLFVIRYRRRRGAAPGRIGPVPTHNTALELTWTIIPLILVGVIFYLGFTGFMDISTPPQNTYDVQVMGQRWKWTFTYPNGLSDENLHVPADKPIRLTMTSIDVIHSLYVPDFRLKRDAVPGRYTTVWFRAAKPGTHEAFCTEYCGKGHSTMEAKVIVQPQEEFDRWLAETEAAIASSTPLELGAKLYRSLGCAQCHSLDGTAGTGPTWKGLFGSTVKTADGKPVVADENYIRESILDPNAKIAFGYAAIMPTYQGRIKDAEIDALITYLKTVK